MIYNLNPIPIYKEKFWYHFSESEKKILYECDLKHISSNNNYFSVNDFILDIPELTDLKRSVQDIFTEFQSKILGVKQNLIITQSWIARTKPRGWHSPHKHPNSMFSSVPYLQTSENSSINFHYDNELFKYLNLEFDKIDSTEYNSNFYKINVEPMDVIIFPSWLVHSVDANLSDTDRIVLGINSFFSGSFGTQSEYPIKLKL
jgi:uncharacterized protein (TIGR02466 family)